MPTLLADAPSAAARSSPLIVLGIVELALAVFCIVDIVRRPAVAGGRKWVWIVIVLLFSLDRIDHLPRGRSRAAARCAETRAEPEAAARGRAAAAADLLYGPVRGGGDELGRGRGRRPPDPPQPPDAAPDSAPTRPPRRRRTTRGRATAAPAVEIAGLTKVYGKARALDGVDLTVRRGLRVRLPRPQRRRQDDHAAHPRRAGPADRRQRAHPRPRRRPRRPAGSTRSSATCRTCPASTSG